MLKVDSAVFNLIDPRVLALLNGKITVNSFAFTIQPYDCMVIVGDTIYALTLFLYYALLPVLPSKLLTKLQFLALLGLPLLLLSEADLEAVRYIRTAKDNCSACRYKAFKNRLRSILLKYDTYRTRLGLDMLAHILKHRDYPGVSKPIPAKLMREHPHLFEQIKYDRVPCFDCVLKHIGMAYVKGTEVLAGYPQHLVLCLANLQLAYELCPIECELLRETILFCIGKTKKLNKPFVPINILCGLVDVFRGNSNSAIALTLNQPAPDMTLLLNENMILELKRIPITLKVSIALIINQIKDLISKLNIDLNKALRIEWVGRMVELADKIVPFSTDISNMVRNRRLIFKAAPSLSKGTLYDCTDILSLLKKS